MGKIFIPTHLDSGNRGCEGITKGISKILNGEKVLIAYSKDVILDQKMGYTCMRLEDISYHSIISKIIFKITKKLMKSQNSMKSILEKYRYESFLKNVSSEDIALSTGGDMFCYDNNDLIFLNNHLHQNGVKTILLGCSIGEENLTPEKIATLYKFSMIITRESLTKQMLEEKLHLSNIVLYPDPAFVLESEKCKIPNYLREKKVVGMNISNFVGVDVGFDTVFGKNVTKLIQYIIEQTNKDIMLVPHVFWDGQDDRIICSAIYEKFKQSKRVYLLGTDELNYCQIRYAISKCQFFIGARTHAMISAYSMCVPSLALGYSIKSKGIAKDLGLPSELVVDYKSLDKEEGLVEAFKYLCNNEIEIKKNLELRIPIYREKAFEMKALLE